MAWLNVQMYACVASNQIKFRIWFKLRVRELSGGDGDTLFDETWQLTIKFVVNFDRFVFFAVS